MRTKLLLAIIGLAISIVPTILFFIPLALVVGVYLLFTEQAWRVTQSGHVWLNYRGGTVGFQPTMLFVTGCFSVVFFVCLRIFLKERKRMKLEKKKSRDAYSAYTT